MFVMSFKGLKAWLEWTKIVQISNCVLEVYIRHGIGLGYEGSFRKVLNIQI